jgi:hypothetical protein
LKPKAEKDFHRRRPTPYYYSLKVNRMLSRTMMT